MSQTATSHLAVPVNDQDHIQGPATAPVTLVEYGDYECPYCGAANTVIQDIQRRMGNNLRYVFRNFPLTQIHPFAEQAAEAAEAAGDQHKFWPMHDLLFENQDHLEAPDLVQYAAELHLDLPRFEQSLVDQTDAPRVLKDLESGTESGVAGTPTFFINGWRYDGSWDEPTLLAALERAAGS